jgi:hypothetical protein
MLRVAEALRDHVKALLRANQIAWKQGHNGAGHYDRDRRVSAHRRPHRRKAQASQEEERTAQQELANKFKRGMAVSLEALGYAAK